MKETKRTLKEFGIVLLIGLLFALTANAVNSQGLKLTRNYFPRRAVPVIATAATKPAISGTTQPTSQISNGASTTEPAVSPPSDDPIVQRLAGEGVGMVTADEVQALLDDPGFESGLYLIVDARNDQHYTEGHIPGAHQLDHYAIERYIGKVLPLAMSAMKIVVYCSGGSSCEDSEQVAMDLIYNYGVERSRLFVYMGGMNEWKSMGRLVEKGERGSGAIEKGKNE